MDNNPDKSKKGEGVTETAKLKGSVDPGRPQVLPNIYLLHVQSTDNP